MSPTAVMPDYNVFLHAPLPVGKSGERRSIAVPSGGALKAAAPLSPATLARAALTELTWKSAPRRRFHHAASRPFLRAAPEPPVAHDSHSRQADLIAPQNGCPKAKLLKFKPR